MYQVASLEYCVRSKWLKWLIKLHGCIVWNAHNAVFGSKCLAICATVELSYNVFFKLSRRCSMEVPRDGHPSYIDVEKNGALFSAAFLVPRHKVWLLPTARVPCSNAANIGRKVNYACGKIPLGGKSPQNVYIVCQPRRQPNIVQSLVDLCWAMSVQ